MFAALQLLFPRLQLDVFLTLQHFLMMCLWCCWVIQQIWIWLTLISKPNISSLSFYASNITTTDSYLMWKTYFFPHIFTFCFLLTWTYEEMCNCAIHIHTISCISISISKGLNIWLQTQHLEKKFIYLLQRLWNVISFIGQVLV